MVGAGWEAAAALGVAGCAQGVGGWAGWAGWQQHRLITETFNLCITLDPCLPTHTRLSSGGRGEGGGGGLGFLQQAK